MTRSSGNARVNCHTHIYSGLVPFGMPEPRIKPTNFLEILGSVWWRLDRALDAETLRAAARYYVADALLAGTSTLIDHHESPNFIEGSLDVLADACDELGMRALLSYGATERNGGRDEGRRGLAECARFLRSNRRKDVIGAVALHASFTVSDETIREAGELCRDLGAIMHVHLAEDRIDVEDAERRGWPGPLERLLDLGALPAGSILAHGVHLSEFQVKRAADERLWLVQNPRSNKGNGVGYPRALAHSDRVALGTDGYLARMHEEMATLFDEAPFQGDRPATVLRRIEAGHDLVKETFHLDSDLFDESIWEDGALVSMRVGDREVVRDGRLVADDIDAIRNDAAEQAARLWKRMEQLN
ncbi:MAG: amidohydrolase family protein [Thermoanaerobaculia bacterium]|jgi:cytosine/adenosine deaminase-related metal-dependent hydrolase